MKADAVILSLANQMYRISHVAKVKLWKHLRNERMRKRVITDSGSHKEWASFDQRKEFNTNLLKNVVPALNKTGPGSSAGSGTLEVQAIHDWPRFIARLLASGEDEHGGSHALFPERWQRPLSRSGAGKPWHTWVSCPRRRHSHTGKATLLWNTRTSSEALFFFNSA